MPALDTQLTTALKTAKTKSMFFALVAKGLDGKLLVDKKKIPAKEIAETKKECGGGTIYKGRCHGEGNGALVFEVAKETPGTLPSVVKKIIKENTGLTFKTVVFRINVEVEDEPDESGEPGLSPGVPPPPGVDPDVQRFAERLKALAPQLQSALAAAKPAAQDAKLKISQANQIFRTKAYAQANVLLDEAELLVKRALADDDKSADPSQQAWEKQFASLEPDYLEVLRVNPPEAGKLRALMAFATGKADAGEYAKALAGVKEVEALLVAITERSDAFRKKWKAARLDLQVALDEVSAQLAEFAGALMDSGEANLIWVAEEGLGEVLNGLRAAAFQIESATSKSPAKVVAKARPAIAELRAQLATPRVQACDNNQLGVTVTIQSTIAAAIKRLEATLALAGA